MTCPACNSAALPMQPTPEGWTWECGSKMSPAGDWDQSETCEQQENEQCAQA